MSLRSLALAAGLCASAALARTDLAGCTYTELVIRPTQQADYASRLYYVPDTGEVCALLDCGGGRAPPKTTVPGCPQYEGTDTYKPSYIDPKTLGDGVLRPGTTVVMATEPVMATAAAAASSSSTRATSATAAAPASSSAPASSATETETPSVITLTGTNTGTASGVVGTGGASSASGAASSSSSSSSGAAATTSPSAAAGAMQTVGAVLGPCVMAAVAALA